MSALPPDIVDPPTPEAPAEVEDAAAAGGAKRPGLGVIGWLSAAWLILVALVAILAPVLPVDDPTQPVRGLARQGLMSDGHILGGDALGRDVLSRLVFGARSSLLVGVGSVLLGLVVGGTLGLISGFRRGRADTFLSSLFDILLAFPQLVLALSLVAFLRPDPGQGSGAAAATGGAAAEVPKSGLTTIQILIIALGVVAIPLLARITRATTLSWAQREFVLAARAQGAKNARLMVREVLPNVLPAMFSIALLGVGVAIIAEGGLSILGVGIELPTPSWGNMIAENRNVRNAPTNALFSPIVAVFLTLMALNYLGDAVRRKFDVRDSAL
ncbi:MAG TPA: ABC transporter permease [Acidimicrobiales bacterium]|nr:ABC transporter permease [Acidimicrobiales bacterium]